MAQITYASIEPLLQGAEERSASIRATFVCPVTSQEITSEGPLEKGRELEDVCPHDDDSLLGSLRSALGGLLSSVLGGPAAVEVTRAPGAEHEPYSDSERKAGIVLAFHGVANQFVWDPQAERWISLEGAGELLTEFDRLLNVAPIQSADFPVASRMLVEVARADGQVTPTEWAFLASFIPGDRKSIDDYMDAPALTPDELNAASKGASRDTMLMLAWALAHVDHHLDRDEVEQLLGYARGLKIPASRAHELQAYAQDYLLEEALQRAYPRGKLKRARREEAQSLGAQMGMTEQEVGAFEKRFKRRWGID